MKKFLIIFIIILAPFTMGCAKVGDVQNQVEPDVEIVVEAFQFDFEPRTITVKTGERVRLTLYNRDTSHGIDIPDIGVHVEAPGGESASVDFTAPGPGRYPFDCSVFCGRGHREMKGMLVVTE